MLPKSLTSPINWCVVPDKQTPDPHDHGSWTMTVSHGSAPPPAAHLEEVHIKVLAAAQGLHLRVGCRGVAAQEVGLEADEAGGRLVPG